MWALRRTAITMDSLFCHLNEVKKSLKRKQILSVILCIALLWTALVAVDFFRLTSVAGHHDESFRYPLIQMGSTHYAYDYTIEYGLGYAVRYDYSGDETYQIQKTTFQILGHTVYEREKQDYQKT